MLVGGTAIEVIAAEVVAHRAVLEWKMAVDTPMLVILIGIIGGTISYGITGLFLGPVVLAVIWELLVVWIRGATSASKSCR